jgi:hypothetical protein
VCVVARLPQFLQPWSFDVTFFECSYNNPIVLLGPGKNFSIWQPSWGLFFKFKNICEFVRMVWSLDFLLWVGAHKGR